MTLRSNPDSREGAGPERPLTPGHLSVTVPEPPTSLRELFMVVREDHRINSEGLWTPGFYALAAQRLGAWAASGHVAKPVGGLARVASGLAYLLVRNVLGIQIPATVRLGRRVRVAHQHGIVVHPYAVIGDECVIRQGVTVGAGRGGDPETFLREAPQLGRGVSLGVGCVVVGRVVVGDGATIGPNAVVMTHIPPGATVLAQPPRIVPGRRQGDAT